MFLRMSSNNLYSYIYIYMYAIHWSIAYNAIVGSVSHCIPSVHNLFLIIINISLVQYIYIYIGWPNKHYHSYTWTQRTAGNETVKTAGRQAGSEWGLRRRTCVNCLIRVTPCRIKVAQRTAPHLTALSVVLCLSVLTSKYVLLVVNITIKYNI